MSIGYTIGICYNKNTSVNEDTSSSTNNIRKDYDMSKYMGNQKWHYIALRIFWNE